MVKKSDSKLLEETKNIIRLKHYSIHTERTYCEWIKGYISFHNMKNRDDLNNRESKIEVFLKKSGDSIYLFRFCFPSGFLRS
jgi:hypothetical protein